MEAASAALWTPEGAETLAYLRVRGLTDDTIRAAGLGWTRRAEGVAWKPPGLVIPWTDGGRLRMVKIRPPDAWRDRFPGGRKPPKYIEAFRDRPGLYVARPPVPGHPLVVCEGELDALLIAQESAAWPCAVVTGGSASFRPDAALAGSLVSSFPWILAHDADEAGDRAAEAWKALAPGRCRRLRPPIDPAGGKDWGDIHGAAFNAIRYHLAPLLSAGPSWEALDTQSRAEVSDADEPDDIQSGD